MQPFGLLFFRPSYVSQPARLVLWRNAEQLFSRAEWHLAFVSAGSICAVALACEGLGRIFGDPHYLRVVAFCYAVFIAPVVSVEMAKRHFWRNFHRAIAAGTDVLIEEADPIPGHRRFDGVKGPL